MPEADPITLSGVSETLLTTLYLRAQESQRPDALIKDEKAEALVAKLSYDFDRIRHIPLSEANKLVMILRSRQFDRWAQAFLERHPDGVVVHIGCGLDARFERVDNGRVEWIDLDLPDVIALRRTLLGGETQRYHLLACSVLEDAWLEGMRAYSSRPFLFLAEGVFMYFAGAQVKRLVLALRQRFPGAQLVFDAYSPLHVLRHNLQTSSSKIAHYVRWGIWRGQALERWGVGVRLLEEWAYIDEPDPRLAPMRWQRPLEHLFRTLRIYRFRLGKSGSH